MTDLNRAAEAYCDKLDEGVHPGTVFGEDVWFSIYAVEDAFKAGHAHAMQSPEVLALVEALKEVKFIAENSNGFNHGAVQLRIVETVREKLAAWAERGK